HPLANADVVAIEDAWRDRFVVLVRGQQLSDPQLLAFSQNFGELDPPGPNPYGEPINKAHPQINVISNVLENDRPIGNLGLGVAERDALLDALWAHAAEPRFAMCHEWEVGDLLMWNNLSLLHRRDPFDAKARRVMHRTQIKGDERVA